jgi:sugar-specific transcriptional regulator TrmB
MVDPDSVLQNLQERDKWRRRMAVLERSLDEVRSRRLREENRLRRLHQERKQVETALEAVLDAAKVQSPPGKVDAAQRVPLHLR